MLSQGTRNTLLAAILTVLMLAALGGIINVDRTSRQAARNTRISARNTRILTCLGAAQQQFNRNIVVLISDGRDPAKFRALVARMKAQAQINYADLLDDECRVAAVGTTPPTSTKGTP